MSKDLFEAALAAEGISGIQADVARSIYMQESGGGRNTKTSNAGAHGGMQIIPSTFKSVADQGWDINDPMHNARAGIRYVSQMFKQAGGDPALTAAGYYGGPGGLEKARNGIAVSDPRNPNAPTTLQYGQQVAARLGKSTAPLQVAQVNPASRNVPEVQAVAPIQVAQSTTVDKPTVIPAEAPVQVAQQPEVDPWMGFQQAMPSPVRLADLNFGSQQPVPQVQPNFGAFTGFSGRKLGRV